MRTYTIFSGFNLNLKSVCIWLHRLLIAVAATFFLSSNALAGVIVSSLDQEWRQVTDTANLFSWNSVNSLCTGASNFQCSGELSGVAFDGWTWASSADVIALFESYSGQSTGNSSYSEANSSWATNFFNDFSPTRPESTFNQIFGFVRDRTCGFSSCSTNVHVLLNWFAPGATDFYNSFGTNTSGVPIHSGVWLYKDATVPEPTTLALLSLGLFGLGFSRRKRLH